MEQRLIRAESATETGPADSSPGPLSDLLVLDMAQFLAGPSAALQLADLGARVIKIERPETGDLCRDLYLSDTDIAGDSTLFHAINRNKESLAVDLKNPAHLDQLRQLVAQADVIIQNFRPGVIERLGLGYEDVKAINPRLVYASVSGFGSAGPWATLPGQDLLAQARSGVMWLTGSADHGPMPIGLSVADMLAGHVLAKGILALLVRRARTGLGGRVETSLLEVLVDFQFELLTTYLNDGQRPPTRAAAHGANAYLAAPYGVYRTRDGHLALAMTPLAKVGELLDLPGLGDAGNGFGRVNHADGLRLRLVRFIPNHATILPNKSQGLPGREVVGFAGLISSAVEIGFGRTVTEFGARFSTEELTNVAPCVPINFFPIFIGAGKSLVVFGLKSRFFAGITEQIFTENCHLGIRHLRETIDVFRFVRIGAIGFGQSRVHIFKDGLQFFILIDVLVQLHELTAFNEGADPLTV